MQRRDFVKLTSAGAGASLLTSCGPATDPRQVSSRLVLLAFDGMDPRIARSLMEQGRLPNYSRLAQQGSFTKIGTVTPPHTPVAFSSIISGALPSVHQIFDFIHRDVQPRGQSGIEPFFSTARAERPESQWALSLGQWTLPLVGGETKLLRQGKAFWDYLVEHGVDADVYYLPANFPVGQTSKGRGRLQAISGMGTPDLLGGYGEFTKFTASTSFRGQRVGGGRFTYLAMRNHRCQVKLEGPPNLIKKVDGRGRTEVLAATLHVVRDPQAPVAKIEVSGNLVLLNEGEWSDWVPVDFHSGIPGASVLNAAGAPTIVRGMVQMYLAQVHPQLELYVSPINIDPLEPIFPISTPADFACQLAEKHGRFATLGIPEDTKALSHGALSEEEFLQQVDLGMHERIVQYRDALARHKSGCLFFYFGATDLVQHMFWRDRDPQHPGRLEEQGDRFASVVDELYIKTDQLVGETLDTLGDDDTLIVFSDHGFTSFRRGFNLNSWLQEKGYIQLLRQRRGENADLLRDTDWAGTQAYGLGMNALYLNLAGRESNGTVKDSDRSRLLEEIREELLEVRDVDGSAVMDRVDFTEDLYPGADPRVAPDCILGYRDGYRASWDTILGTMTREVIGDNLDRWSGTHLISADLVAGMIFSNRKIVSNQPHLTDIAPTILSLFGIAKPSQMTGHDLFALRS